MREYIYLIVVRSSWIMDFELLLVNKAKEIRKQHKVFCLIFLEIDRLCVYFCLFLRLLFLPQFMFSF